MHKITLAEKPHLAIQGEGEHSGYPVIFLRTMGCQLSCSWCDSKKTWHPDYKDRADVMRLTPKEAVDLLKEVSGDTGIKRIVFTGGEPTMHRKALEEIMDILVKEGWRFEIETNGGFDNVTDSFIKRFEIYTCSPKRFNSGNNIDTAENFKVISMLSGEGRHNVYFKFVVQSEKDLTDVQHFVDFYGIQNEQIFLMPEGFTKKTLLPRFTEILELCIKNNWKFSPRLHIIAYDDKDGV